MAVSRYQKDTIIGAPRRLSTAAAVLRIRQSITWRATYSVTVDSGGC
jgi:hypothetical protein